MEHICRQTDEQINSGTDQPPICFSIDKQTCSNGWMDRTRERLQELDGWIFF